MIWLTSYCWFCNLFACLRPIVINVLYMQCFFLFFSPMAFVRRVIKRLTYLLTSDHWHSMARPHIACSLAAALASSPPASSVQFKLAVLVFKALHGQAPQCLTDDCQLFAAAGRRQLWSSDAITCLVPRTRTCLGDRAFGVAGPRLWNTLPFSLR